MYEEGYKIFSNENSSEFRPRYCVSSISKSGFQVVDRM